jgi:hypothetical protein
MYLVKLFTYFIHSCIQILVEFKKFRNTIYLYLNNNLIVNPKEKTHSYILSGFEVPFIFILVIQH